MCNLAVQLHQATGDTLAGAAASAGRRQLSEEHVTYKLLDLIDGFAADGAPIWIRDYGRSDESANGADLELWFWERGGGLAVGWLVQAKRLSPPETAASAPKFKSIRHKVGGKLQSDLLIEAAAKVNGLMPLYWLYSWDLPARTRCSGDPSCKCTPSTFDEALIVAHAETVKASTGSSWHSVVQNNITSVESLRRLWCNGALRIWV